MDKLEKITSRNNAKVKHMCSLHNSRSAREFGEMILEGPKLVEEALALGVEVMEFFMTEEYYLKELGKIELTLPHYLITEDVLTKMATTRTPQGIIGRAKRPIHKLEAFKSLQKLLILDGLQDPGNVGSLFRSAAAVGIEGVILFPPLVDPYQAKVLRSSAGNIFRLAILALKEEEVKESLEIILDNFNIYLAEAHGGQAYNQLEYKRPLALVLGSEAHGIQECFLNIPNATRVTIPLASGVESLNVATAGAVLLFASQKC